MVEKSITRPIQRGWEEGVKEAEAEAEEEESERDVGADQISRECTLLRAGPSSVYVAQHVWPG